MRGREWTEQERGEERDPEMEKLKGERCSAVVVREVSRFEHQILPKYSTIESVSEILKGPIPKGSRFKSPVKFGGQIDGSQAPSISLNFAWPKSVPAPSSSKGLRGSPSLGGFFRLAASAEGVQWGWVGEGGGWCLPVIRRWKLDTYLQASEYFRNLK